MKILDRDHAQPLDMGRVGNQPLRDEAEPGAAGRQRQLQGAADRCSAIWGWSARTPSSAGTKIESAMPGDTPMRSGPAGIDRVSRVSASVARNTAMQRR